MTPRLAMVLGFRVVLLGLLAAAALWAAASSHLPLWPASLAFAPLVAAVALAAAYEASGGERRGLLAWTWSGLIFALSAGALLVTTLGEGVDPRLVALLLLGAVIATARGLAGGGFAGVLAAGGLAFLLGAPMGSDLGGVEVLTHALLLVAAGLFTGFLSQAVEAERAEHVAQAAELRQELLDLGEHLRNVLASVASGVLVVDREGRVRTYNRAAEQILGVPQHHALGRTLTDVASLEPLAPLLRAAPPEADAARADTEYVDPRGARRRIGFALSPLQNLAGEELGRILVFQDVTLIRDYEARLLRQEQLAALGRMVSGIAHEFGNLLGGTKGLVELALADDSEEEALQTLPVVRDSLARALGTVENLLKFARGAPLHRVAGVDLRAVLERALQLTRAEAEAAGVEVELRAEPLPPLWADAIQLEQVLLNLVINAIHAVAGRERRQVRVRAAPSPRGVRVTVEDTGPGVPPELAGRVFEPFFTTKGSLGGSEVPGTGLGLAVALGIVTRHDGTLEVDVSGDLGGACFVLELPSTNGDGAESS